jgi:hypothetical protein
MATMLALGSAWCEAVRASFADTWIRSEISPGATGLRLRCFGFGLRFGFSELCRCFRCGILS